MRGMIVSRVALNCYVFMVHRFFDKQLGVVVELYSRRGAVQTRVRVKDGVVRLSIPESMRYMYAGNVLPQNVAEAAIELLARDKVLQQRNERFRLGVPIVTPRVIIEVTTNRQVRVDELRHSYDKDNRRLLLEVNEDTDIERGFFQKLMRRVVGERMKEIAGVYLYDRVYELARRYGFRISGLSFRSASSRWGSCSSNGKVMISGYLYLLPDDVVDYVIVHEFCHLRYMNHGPEFKRLLHGFFPDYERREAELKEFSVKYGWLMR